MNLWDMFELLKVNNFKRSFTQLEINYKFNNQTCIKVNHGHEINN